MKQVILFLIVAIFTYLFTFIVRKIAFVLGAIDKPGKRKIHKEPMPLLGGVAIYLGFMIGLSFSGRNLSNNFPISIRSSIFDPLTSVII